MKRAAFILFALGAAWAAMRDQHGLSALILLFLLLFKVWGLYGLETETSDPGGSDVDPENLPADV